MSDASKIKEYSIRKKDAGSMSSEELLAWAEGKVLCTSMYNAEKEGFEHQPPLNDDEVSQDNLVPWQSDMEIEGNSMAMDNIEVDLVDYGINVADRGLEIMNDAARGDEHKDDEAMGVEDMDDSSRGNNIDEEVLARQKKLDKGKAVMTKDDSVKTNKRKNVHRGNGISIRENERPLSPNSESDSDSEENIDKYDNYVSDTDTD